ncbi:MAG TPA: T9SS type A sorting domain-containing protein [Bacteroidetes bacterium]|nr:T9SS type A sorting domain-containing protein [Bacteroidota bacterium]
MQASSKILALALLLSMAAGKGLAQVWPGDVNNNGIVNNIDLLYLGQALFENGPPRLPMDIGIEWEEKPIMALWPQAFPDGTNYAFADCDGDGVVSQMDQDAIEFNYGLTHGTVSPDVFVAGMPGVAPPLSIDALAGSIFENSFAAMTIDLGTSALEVNDLRGIAFTIKYDPDIFGADPVQFFPGEWIDSGPGGLLVSINKDVAAGEIEVGLSRMGMPLSGSGVVGTFLIVIEDDVVGLETSIETVMSIKDVRVLMSDFNDLPVFADSTVVTILNNDFVSSTSELEQSIQVYPLPATGRLFIETTNHTVGGFEISSLSGKVLLAEKVENGRGRIPIRLDGLAPGMYLLKLDTDSGPLIKKIIVQ